MWLRLPMRKTVKNTIKVEPYYLPSGAGHDAMAITLDKQIYF